VFLSGLRGAGFDAISLIALRFTASRIITDIGVRAHRRLAASCPMRLD
jgi:hypothetical protein